MNEALRGKVLRRHIAVATQLDGCDGAAPSKTATPYEDIGRIVLVSNAQQGVYYIPYPKLRRGKKATKVAKIAVPKFLSNDELEAMLESLEYSIVEFVRPGSWILTEKKLEELAKLQRMYKETNIQGYRRNVEFIGAGSRDFGKWLRRLKKNEALVAPIFKSYTDRDLIEFGCLAGAIRDRLKDKDCTCGRDTLLRLVLLKLQGCGHACSLLPAWEFVGSKGSQKFGEKKVGAKNRLVRRKISEDEGYVCVPADREKLDQGFVKYKRKHISIFDAYLMTMAEHWPGDSEEVRETKMNRRRSERVIYKLLPPNERPTFRQFRTAAKEHSASKVNLGERLHSKCNRVLQRQESDEVVAVGQLAMIDSTSEDQTPVSAGSRLKVLSTTWRSVVVEVKTRYILGFYSGFERPSTLTNLLAIYHGAISKVEFCAGYGITITDDEWKSRLCKTIRGDNGELKSLTTFAVMEHSEVSLEFARSWESDDKGTVEGSHHAAHKGADHKNAGTTGGTRLERGEESRDRAACRTHRENQFDFIEWVLFYNNKQPVPHLIPLEMHLDGWKTATRKEIYEWYERKGYVASEPTDLESLRVHCLPEMEASITREGVKLFNPLKPAEHVFNLYYTGQVLSRLWRRTEVRCKLHLDPSDLSRAFIRVGDELHELVRKTNDPLINELSLKEYIDMTEEIKDGVALCREDVENDSAKRITQISATNATAKRLRREEAHAAKEAGDAIAIAAKRDLTVQELRRESLERKGLDPEQLCPQADMQLTQAEEGQAGAGAVLAGAANGTSASAAAALALQALMARAREVGP